MAEGTRRRRSILSPIIGLLIVVILGAAAWLVAPDLIRWLAVTLPNFAGNELPFSLLRPVVTAIIVLLTVIALALFAALVAPRQNPRTSAARLEQEREALRRRQKATRTQARKSKGRTE